MALSRAGDRAGHVHRAVRRAAGLRDRARAAADDVDLRVGHPHRRLRRARRASTRSRATPPAATSRRRSRAATQAVADVESMRELGRRRRMPRPGATARMRDAFLGTMDYEVDVLRLLAAYRAMILHQGAVARHALAATRTPRGMPTATSSRRSPPRTSSGTTGDIDYPAYNLTAAELGVRARRPRPGDGVDRPRAARCSPAPGS